MTSLHFKITNDHLLLDSLDSKCFPADYRHDFARDKSWIIHDGKGKLIGYTCLTPWSDGIVFLSRCGSLKKGLKLQRAAISHRIAWAKRNGYKTVISYVSKDNYKSIANMIKAGFKFYEPDYAWVGRDFYYFQKTLR